MYTKNFIELIGRKSSFLISISQTEILGEVFRLFLAGVVSTHTTCSRFNREMKLKQVIFYFCTASAFCIPKRRFRENYTVPYIYPVPNFFFWWGKVTIKNVLRIVRYIPGCRSHLEPVSMFMERS